MTALRVLLLGATGSIGEATARELLARGHEVVCFVRPRAGVGGRLGREDIAARLPGATLRFGEATDAAALRRDGFAGESFDAVVSCLASRKGAPADAWAIEYQANLNALEAAKASGVGHFLLLSAICVQKPKLAFQHAKLAFERELLASGLPFTIVRPTAFFKSLSGQIGRLREGKPYLLFGDGRLTACKPISDGDLARYLADRLDDENARGKILPVGGPGPAITPREQGEKLFELMGLPPKFRSAPVALMDAVVGALTALGAVWPPLRDKAEFARIGRYYATESMLLWNEQTARYDADATPSFGTETLFDYYAKLIRGEAPLERGDHAVF